MAESVKSSLLVVIHLPKASRLVSVVNHLNTSLIAPSLLGDRWPKEKLRDLFFGNPCTTGRLWAGDRDTLYLRCCQKKSRTAPVWTLLCSSIRGGSDSVQVQRTKNQTMELPEALLFNQTLYFMQQVRETSAAFTSSLLWIYIFTTKSHLLPFSLFLNDML